MSNKGSTSQEILDGAGLYYGRLIAFFDAIAEYNETRGIYDKLDQWMPPAVRTVFERSYSGKRDVVIEKYNERKGRIERTWGYVVETMDELKISYTDEDLRNFRALARGTQGETAFRTKMRGRVKRLHDNVNKENVRRDNGEQPKPIKIETLADLLAWYRIPRGKKK